MQDHDTIRVLLVDDEVSYIDVLSRRLKKRGFQVECATSGKEAVQKLRESTFDIAIVDLKMEDINGLEVLRIFNIMEPNMPVIMLTGHGSEEAATKAQDLGVFDYLGKPCDFETLLERINRAVSPRRV